MKHLFIDTETTGTNPDRHGMIQMAGALFVDRKMVDQFNYNIRPFSQDEIEEEALQVNGKTPEQLLTFEDPGTVYSDFTKRLGNHCNKFDRMDKIHLVGYNADFDSDFMRAFFVKNGDTYFQSWFWFPVLDVAKIAGVRLQHVRHTLPNFKLMTIAKYFGVDLAGDAHDALYDVRITMRLWKTVLGDVPEWIPGSSARTYERTV